MPAWIQSNNFRHLEIEGENGSVGDRERERMEGRLHKSNCVWHFAFDAIMVSGWQIAMLNTTRISIRDFFFFPFHWYDERKLSYRHTDLWKLKSRWVCVCVWFDTKMQKRFHFNVENPSFFVNTDEQKKIKNRWWWFQFENDLHCQNDSKFCSSAMTVVQKFLFIFRVYTVQCTCVYACMYLRVFYFILGTLFTYACNEHTPANVCECVCASVVEYCTHIAKSPIIKYHGVIAVVVVVVLIAVIVIVVVVVMFQSSFPGQFIFIHTLAHKFKCHFIPISFFFFFFLRFYFSSKKRADFYLFLFRLQGICTIHCMHCMCVQRVVYTSSTVSYCFLNLKLLSLLLLYSCVPPPPPHLTLYCYCLRCDFSMHFQPETKSIYNIYYYCLYCIIYYILSSFYCFG